MPAKKKQPSTRSVKRDIVARPDTPENLAAEMGVTEDMLALAVDRGLGTTTWAGTTVADRTAHTLRLVGEDLLGSVERSLLAQESYEEFEGRIFRQMGIEKIDEPLGPLRDLDLQLKQDAKLAWNTGLVAANQQEDTVPIWRAVLDDRTTAFCWAAHGKTIDEVGQTPPAHWQCRCDILTVPLPDSDNAEWAAMGRDVLDEMAAERESGQAVESAKPSRLWQRLVEAGEFDPTKHPREPAGSERGGEFAAGAGGKALWEMTTDEFDRLFPLQHFTSSDAFTRFDLSKTPGGPGHGSLGKGAYFYLPEQRKKLAVFGSTELRATLPVGHIVDGRTEDGEAEIARIFHDVPLDEIPIVAKANGIAGIIDSQEGLVVYDPSAIVFVEPHRTQVVDALAHGLLVPDHVLSAYPELRRARREVAVRPSRIWARLMEQRC